MISTQEVLAILKEANPTETVTEDRIRRVIRCGDIPPPGIFAGRYAWTRQLVLILAEHLGLNAPSYGDFPGKANEKQS